MDLPELLLQFGRPNALQVKEELHFQPVYFDSFYFHRIQNYLEMISASVGKKQIWAIGGGKGGSGKSLIAANLGIRLARAGHRVTILDFDWGGGNLHTYLGMRAPSNTMADFILRRISRLMRPSRG